MSDLAAVMLWQEAINSFMRWVGHRKGVDRQRMVRRNTRSTYRAGLRQFLFGSDDLLANGFEPALPWQVTAATARSYKEAMLFARKAPATVNTRLAGLKLFYDYVINQYRLPRQAYFEPLVRVGYLHPDPDSRGQLALVPPATPNPFTAAKVTRLEVKAFGRSKYPSRRQMDEILAAIDLSTLNGLRDYALLTTIVTTSRRIEEVRNLRWGDISIQDDGQRVFTYIGKGYKEGRSPLGAHTWQAIETYLRAGGRWQQMEDDHFIFVAHKGREQGDYRYTPQRPLSYEGCNKMLKTYGLAAGVDGKLAHLHGLRHRSLHNRKAEMKRTGVVDMLALRDTAGHASIATTELYLQNSDHTVDDPYLDQADAAHARRLPEISEEGGEEP